jgi:hypothetical protein
MGEIGHKLLPCIAILGLHGLGSMNGALATPPVHRKAAAPLNSHPTLDLRPSVTALAAADKTLAVFPSSLHPHSLNAPDPIELPSLGADRGAQSRIPSRMEEFARRVHREGLPVARLWENKSALVSLGLDKKGKPGLWIVQKVR